MHVNRRERTDISAAVACLVRIADRAQHELVLSDQVLTVSAKAVARLVDPVEYAIVGVFPAIGARVIFIQHLQVSEGCSVPVTSHSVNLRQFGHARG